MGNKKDIKVYIFPILVFLAFLFSIIGYKQVLGDEFSLVRVIYAIFTSFVLENIKPDEILNNPFLLMGRYCAALLLGFGIYTLLYRHIFAAYIKFKIKNSYRNHVIVFSLKKVGSDFLSNLLENNYKTILVEDPSGDVYLEKIEKDGVIVFGKEHYGTKLFDTMLLSQAKACIVAYEEDKVNIALTLKLIKYLRKKSHGQPVRILTHIHNTGNLEVVQDYTDISDANDNFELDIFNISNAAAKKMYDQFPPHHYFSFKDPAEENAIAVVGYNQAAEDFIMENLILSHYKDGNNIKIYLAHQDADNISGRFMYEYPFCSEFIDLIPVKLHNNKFFAGFSSSADLAAKLGKVKAAYFFGNEGAALMNTAVRFRQFLYGQRTNHLETPIVLCFPEDTDIVHLLDAERENSQPLEDIFEQNLNIRIINMVSDTCTSSRLLEEREYIDSLSRVINYYYSIKYEFEAVLKEKWHVPEAAKLVASLEQKFNELADKHAALTENDIENLILENISHFIKKPAEELRPSFSIKKWWNHISYHKKDANRYAARHLAIKISIMDNMGCTPLTHENIVACFPVIAPIEHKRWSAEKMALNYRYGTLPADKAANNMVKELLKIHDQLIPYRELSEIEKEKDLNIFLLMPLLCSLKVEIKK